MIVSENQENINERKNIIVSLKSSLDIPKKGIKYKIKALKIVILIYLLLTIITVGMLSLSIIAELFNYELLKWQNTGLFAVMSLSITLNLSNKIFELKLLRHLININTIFDFEGITKLNDELKEIIDQLNNRFKLNKSVMLLVIFLLIMGIWQMGFQNNQYWDFMKLPFLVFYGILLFDFIRKNKRLSKNIKETERHCN